MTTVFFSVFQLLLIAIQQRNVFLQSPPQLIQHFGNSQKIVRPGISTTLTCPVRGNKDSLMFEWLKDKESLMAFEGQRLRVTNSGALRIKETIFDDTGLYTCRAVNGFGSVEYNTTLLVLGEDEDYETYDDLDEDDEFTVDQEDSTHRISLPAKPHLLYVTEGSSPFHRKPGSPLKLHCVASGLPKPEIMWYKDGAQLSRSFRRGRWSINFSKLTPIDSGNYTCTASNLLGSASHSFIINVEVIDSMGNAKGKPLLMGPEPSNTTVQEGQTAIMQCSVKSVSSPSIEWLKQVDPSELDDDERRNAIKMDGEFFRVLGSSDVINRQDSTFYNKLVIEESRIKDTGKYVCLGTNIFGFSYRYAFLFVLPREFESSDTSIPFPIFVAITVVVVAALAGIFSLLIYCRNQQSSSSRGSSTAVPMVTKDVFLPLHQGSAHGTRCPLDRGRTKHHTTLYTPANVGKEIF